MIGGQDLYQYTERLERKVNNIKTAKGYSKHNRNKIMEFQRHCIASGIGPARVLRYLNDLPHIAAFLNKKDFEKASKTDIENFLVHLEKSKYMPRTKLDFKITIKKFYKWLNGGEEYPDSIKWIKTGEKLNNNKLPEELLTEEEVKKLVQYCQHSRDRALISILWESGCRVGELLSLQMKHVSFEETLTRITVQGKTGMRRIPLIDSTPFLAEWMENHPQKGNPEAPLWVGIGTVGRNRMLEYAALRKMLKVIAVNAGVKKAVNPHSFRHSRATFLAKHLKEAELTQYMGWVQGSDVPSVYVHLSGRDLDDSILRMRGLKPKEESSEGTMAPKKCPRCTLINKATGRFCTRCGAVLDLETAMAVTDEAKGLDDRLSLLLQDSEVQEVLVRKIREMKIAAP